MNTDPTRATWRKSSYSGGSGGECVEVADLTAVVGIRDSKDSGGPRLTLGTAQFGALVQVLKSGRPSR
ncbi:DUF397 domain-containing protein [Actinomadura oligospora]|uniref:DUF397 domain-containing protein n=1 Tax=Actinomadura oligospora TaxID=111804 RepID=UPI000479EF72|nr:DUF397 domain-containing protein [Actinomadura oligospora]